MSSPCPVATPLTVPMAAPLAAAARVCRGLVAGVASLFDAARDGQPLPMSTADHAVHALLACLRADAGALTSLLRLKAHDDDGCLHAMAVCALMGGLARSMRMGPMAQRQAALAGLLHDIGKALVPAEVLDKPGRLTREEYATVRLHPGYGTQVLQGTGGIDDAVMDAVRHHHERPDGHGYPDQLAGDQLSLYARMLAVCDVYDAITSNRPYKDGWEPAGALRRMDEWARAGQFDPAVLAAFRGMVGTYPVGSLVRLRSERLAVVSAHRTGRPELPSVTVFYCARSHRSLPPELADLQDPDAADEIVDLELNSVWRFSDLESLWAGPWARGHTPQPKENRPWRSP